MRPLPIIDRARISPAVLLLEAVAGALGVIAAVGTWITTMVAGFLMGVVALPYPDQTSSPYDTAWLLGSVATAVVAGFTSWRWLRRRDEAARRWWQ